MKDNYPVNYLAITSSDVTDYLVFLLNKNNYAIPVKNVIEVVNFSLLENIQSTPAAIIGLYNYKGTMIKVVDLSPLLGLDTEKFSINDKFIILKDNDDIFAIHAKEIFDIEKFNKSNFQNFPYELENSIIDYVYKKENEYISIIDIDRVIGLLSVNKSLGDVDYLSLMPSSENDKKVLEERLLKNELKISSFNFLSNQVNSVQYVLFALNGQNYFLDLKYVKQIESTKHFNITKLPYSRDFIVGITNIKGQFLVVVDLRKFLNDYSELQIENSKLLIVEGNNFNIAFLVDSIKNITNIKEDQINLQQSQSEYVISEFIENNELYCLLDFEKIINDERLYINI